MSFSSFFFILGFMPLFFLLYYLLPAAWRTGWLLLGSLFFYGWGCRDALWQLIFMGALVYFDYCLGLVLGVRHSKFLLTLGLAVNLLPLLFFKYFAPLTSDALTTPLGLSFLTFQGCAYLLDVGWNTTPPERSPIRAGCYFFLFPHVASGPILSYRETAPQLCCPAPKLSSIDRGLREFAIGLSLKLLLADRVGRLWQDVAAIGYESISTPLAWMALIAYSLQLYLDFYGYSRMAVGLGYMLGLELPRNFCYPYTAHSMTDFWRRWHMSLSRWFRDYLYIPLGGSRCGAAKTVRNLLVVWLATGIWHGASFNFILWGLALFVLLVLEKAGLKKLFDCLPILGHLYMLLAIPLTWLIFGITNLGQLGLYFSRLFPSQGAAMGLNQTDFIKYLGQYGWLLAVGILFSTPLPRRIYKRCSSRLVTTLLLLAAFWLCLYCIYRGQNDPFLYFQF